MALVASNFAAIRKNGALVPATTTNGVPDSGNITGTFIVSCTAGDIVDFVPVLSPIAINSPGPGVNAVSVSIKKIG